MARPVAVDPHDRRRSPPQCRTSPSHQLKRTLGEKQRSRSYKRPGQRVHAASLAHTMSGALGFDDAGWAQIEVPGHWQLQGHGNPAYTNVNYPFPVDPPNVPDENPTGEYRCLFQLPAGWPAGEAVLRFLGVDSAFTVWCNGAELGWSSGSRLTTEFEVGSHLRAGANVVAVRVHQWSPASYLEDQDMWWLSGIFRNVSVISRPAGSIDDYFFHTDFDHVNGTG